MAHKDEKGFRAFLREALGQTKAEEIAEKRDEAKETVAKATESGDITKDDGTNTSYAKMFGEFLSGAMTQRRTIGDDGELLASADQLAKNPAGTVQAKRAGLVLRALAASNKAGPDEVYDVAIRYLESKHADSGQLQAAIKSLQLGKTLATTTQTAGGVLVAGPAYDAVIEMLRPQATLTALGVREVPLPPGGLIMPTQATGGSGVWLGEEEATPATQPSFGSREMKAKTYSSLCVVSEKLLRSASPAVDQFVMDDLRLDAGTAIDVATLRGTAAAAPRGVRWLGTATPTAGTSDVQIDADLVGGMTRMGNAGLPMNRLGWAFAWNRWQKLFNMRFTNGGWVYRDELRAGNLLGFPYKRSSSVPSNLGGGGAESELYLFELDNIVMGRGEAMGFDQSQDATITVGGNQVSAFQRYLRVIRMMVEVDVNVRHPEAVQVVTAVAWV
jgi:HK97 family phage major capsid protein